MTGPQHAWFSARRNKLRESCRQKKLDGIVTFDFSDVFYLSGFPSEGCFMLVSRAGDFIFAPLLLADHVRAMAGTDAGLTVVSEAPLLKSLGKICSKNHIRRIAYDPGKVTVSLFKALSASLKASWVPLDGFVLAQRMIKDESEIDLISRACHITHEASRICFENLREGQSEIEVSHALEALFRTQGAPKPAFETIVAFQENAAFPHHVATRKKLARNSAVLMDLGCTVDGYRSDLTRTSFFGSMTPKFRKIYNIVKTSQQEGINAVRDGVSAGKVDFICREAIRKSGYGDYFIHGTGHGVGIDIHEPPRLGIRCEDVLRQGMIVTVEPGIYLPGEFGVRIEDTLLVKKNGCEVLTK